MRYSRYTWWFTAAIVVLTVAALASFREISALSLGAQREDTALRWPDDTLPATIPAATVAATYESIAAADESWRQQNARQYTLSELRARGDGRRTPRQQMQDRVYAFTRAGNRSAAIGELERWVEWHPRDADALLWSARLLHEAGRSRESIKRYRQALAVESHR